MTTNNPDLDQLQQVTKASGIFRLCRWGIGTQKIRYEDLAQAALDAGFRSGESKIVDIDQGLDSKVATVHIEPGHNLQDGDTVTIDGVTGGFSRANGSHNISNVTPESFRINLGDHPKTITPSDLANAMAAWDEGTEYIPRKGSKIQNAKSAFERATHIGKKGLVLNPSEDYQKATLKQYGVTPVIKLYSKDVSRKTTGQTRGYTKRLILAEVTIPFVAGSQKDDSDLAKTSQVQYSAQPCWYVEFVPESSDGSPAFVDYPINDAKIFQEAGIKDQVSDAVAAMVDDARSWMDHADDAKIRDGIRQYLADLHAVNEGVGGKGGLYTLPMDDETYKSLKRLKNYIYALRDYSDQSEGTTQPYMLSSVVYLENDDFDEENIAQAAQDVSTSYGTLFAKLDDELRPILEGDRTGKAAQNTALRVLTQVMKAKQGIKKYQQTLGDRIENLDIQTEILMSRIEKAQAKADQG